MKINRKEFLLIAAGMFMGCATSASGKKDEGDGPGARNIKTKPMKPVHEGGMNPPHEEGMNPPHEEGMEPAAECVKWDAAGECIGWEPVGEHAAPAAECVQWDAAGECVAWEE